MIFSFILKEDNNLKIGDKMDNKNDVERYIEVMKAFLEGKQIQYKNKYGCEESCWTDDDNPSWDWATVTYRVKPNINIISRPYKNASEFLKDVENRLNSTYGMTKIAHTIFGGLWLKSRTNDACKKEVNGYDDEGIFLAGTRITYDEAFRLYRYLDGSIVGAKMENTKNEE